jgi:hypothetical protein
MTQNDIDFINQNDFFAFMRWVGMLQKRIDATFSDNSSIPVPFTGRRHGNGCTAYKKPHTIQERRQHEALMTDIDCVLPDGHLLLVRAKRINLPDSFEDKRRSTQRSWKAHRETQYK